MPKMKTFELKNIINEQTKGNIESKAILDYLEKTTGVKKTHSSNLEDNEVSLLRAHFIPQTKAAQTPARKPVKSAEHAGDKPASAAKQVQTAGKTGNTSAHAAKQARAVGQTGNKPAAAAAVKSQPVGQTGAKPAVEQKPSAASGGTRRPETVRPAQMGYQDSQGGYHTGPRPGAAGRPEAGQKPMGQGYQGTQGSYHTGPRPSAAGKPESGQRSMGQGGARHGVSGQTVPGQGYSESHGYQGTQGGYHTGPRPEGAARPEAGQRPNTGQRPAGQDGMRQGAPGPAGHGYQGTQGSYHTGVRPEGAAKSAGESAGRGVAGQNSHGYQGGQRQEGQLNQMQQRTSGQGSQGYQGAGRPNAGQRSNVDQRTAGQGGYRQNGSGQGMQGTHRNTDQYQRFSGSDYQRSGAQGNHQSSGQGYQRSNSDQRTAGQGRSTGSDQGYQRQQGGYRQSGSNTSGQNRSNAPGQNRQGGYTRTDRPQGNGYGQGGSRPGGGYAQGNRPSGGYSQGGRPGQGGYSRPGSGQRPGGYNSRGTDEFKKDEDDKPGYNNRNGQKRPGGGQRSGERKNFDQQILDQKVAEKNDFSNKRNRDRINKEKTYKDKNLIDRDEQEVEGNNIKKIMPKKGQFIQPKPVAAPKEDEIKTITLPEVLTIKELADKMKTPASVLVKKLFLSGKMVSINQEITFEEAEEIALEYEIIAEKEVKVNEIEELLKEAEDAPETLEKRPPVVCVMGHVDHGKTSLLDAIRETNVTSREAGGITQHIGAYVVNVNGEKITFLDTPGHEAFTAMRMRGAQSTDIAILVVAADDGVMPQTIEAINHAKAAGVQIIVAVNKIDKPGANVERVKQELTEYELVAEDSGGDTIFVPVSAHTKEGIEHLLEMILLTAEMLELKANKNRKARGIVIEAELDKGRGPVATVLVQKGTLKIGDNIVVGSSFGKVRAMMDDKGRRVKDALPSTPVEILGLNEVPDAGETFVATDNEKEARTIAEAFISRGKEKLIADTKAKLSLDGLFSQIKAGNIKEFNLIIKADVQGSVEAMKQSLVKLSNEEIAVRIIHGGVGAINESDVILASASNAIIIGFNVRPDNAAKETAEREKVDIKLYRVIYNAIDDIEAAMKGLLDPVYEERIIGHAEVRQTFKASGVGTIAGSYVLDGKIIRGSLVRIYRDNTLTFEGNLASLKRFQDDVKEVAAGYECGLVFEKFNDIKEGDKVELYIMQEVPR